MTMLDEAEKYALVIGSKKFANVLVSRQEDGLYCANCMHFEEKKRLFKASGQDGSNKLKNVRRVGASKGTVLEQITEWAALEFGADVVLEKII